MNTAGTGTLVPQESIFSPMNYTPLGALSLSPGNSISFQTDSASIIGSYVGTGLIATNESKLVEVALFPFTSINIPAGVTVTVQGRRPIALSALGNIAIGANINLDGGDGAKSGNNALGGAGGSGATGNSITNAPPPVNKGAGGRGGSNDGDPPPPTDGIGIGAGRAPFGIRAGGGGAGYAGGGGAGSYPGTSGPAGTPGAMYGNETLTELYGGSGGGGGAAESANLNCGGGGGGGAIELIAGGTIAVSGTISASGGAGGSRNGPGGGGSGGAILLAARNIAFTGTNNVAGGAGGTYSTTHGGGGGSGGRVAFYSTNVYASTPPGVVLAGGQGGVAAGAGAAGSFYDGPSPVVANIAPLARLTSASAAYQGGSMLASGWGSDDGVPAPPALAASWTANRAWATFSSPSAMTSTVSFAGAGTVELTFSTDDGQARVKVEKTVNVIDPLDRAPYAHADGVYTAFQDIAFTLTAAQGVLANDTDEDGDILTATLLRAPTNGAVTLATDGGFTYMPAAGVTGVDSFTYVADDGRGRSDTGMVRFVIVPAVARTVTIAAVQPGIAREIGPTSAFFRVSLSIPASSNVLVTFNITGSAVNAVDYALLYPWVVITNTYSSSLIEVAPVQDAVAETNEFVSIALNPVAGYAFGVQTQDVIVILPMMIDLWKIQYFGPNANSVNAADDRDWEGDLVRNLMEYALYRNPTNFEAADEFTGRVERSGTNDYFNLYYTRRMEMPDARIWVEFTTNLLSGVWFSGSPHIAETATDMWPTQKVTATVVSPAVKNAPFGAARLKVERTEP
ncbi:MAG: hypothetical protein FJ224_10595 [Lentisphaerae bacterium]|nr:hypothetical protein [Lentisphaerota bacterium]